MALQTLEEIKQKRLEFPALDFAVFNNKVYTVAAVDVPVNQAIENIKDFYAHIYQERITELENCLQNHIDTEWHTQLTKIQELHQRTSVIVPPTQFNTPLYVYQKKLCALRIVQYKPNEIVGPAYTFKDRTAERYIHGSSTRTRARAGFAKVYGFIKDLLDETYVHIKINQSVIDRQEYFVFNGSCIYTPKRRLFHTMSSMSLCTGNASAFTFWNDPFFLSNVNIINLYSLASSVEHIPNANIEITPTHLLKDDFIVDMCTAAQGWAA